MQVELVRTTTGDGVVLDGVIHAPRAGSSSGKVDAVICFSGVGTNFYGSDLIEHLALRLSDAGVLALRVNTRGHDGVSIARTARGGILQGAAYEIVDDCRHDVAAWLDYLANRGYARVALLGHSLGALKCLYSQAHAPPSRAAGMVAISPPCLSYNLFRRQTDPTSFEWSLATAQGYCDRGQKDTLFRATFPFPLVLSAGTFLDKYGPGERYNLLEWVTRIECPVQFVFGALELQGENVAFQGIVEKLEGLPWQNKRPTFNILPDANHSYTRQFAALAAAVETAIL